MWAVAGLRALLLHALGPELGLALLAAELHAELGLHAELALEQQQPWQLLQQLHGLQVLQRADLAPLPCQRAGQDLVGPLGVAHVYVAPQRA